jgi:hypothetical protein
MPSVTFDTGDDYISRTTDVPEGTGATMCGWFKASDTGGFGDLMSISNGSNHYFGIEHGGDHVFVHLDAGGGEAFETVFNNATTIREWFFLAFKANAAGGLIAYYHPDSGGSWTAATPISGVDGITGTDFAGFGFDAALGNTGGTFDCCFLRMWSAALSEAELQAERASTEPVRTSNLVFDNAGAAASTVHVDGSGTGNFTTTGTPADSADAPTTPAAPGGAFELEADVAALTLAAADAGLVAARRLAADVAQLALTGADASLVHGYVLTAETAAALLAAADAALQHGYRLTAEVASLVLTGADAALSGAHRIAADVATLALVGDDAGLTYSPIDAELQADAGSLILTAADATLSVSHRLVAEVAVLTLVGADATLHAADSVLVAEAAALQLTAIDAVLTWSAVLAIRGTTLTSLYTASPGALAFDPAATVESADLDPPAWAGSCSFSPASVALSADLDPPVSAGTFQSE